MIFEMLKDKSSIIKVIGVGGGGGNAVNHMYKQGIAGVDFIICNTDSQALESSPIPNKVQLGSSLTEGRGAGSMPVVGMNSAIESIDDVKDLLGSHTKMVFITAGMGGGTGTGASPIICQAAKELGILTVGIVTTPFNFEGKRRKQQADEGLAALKEHVDTLLVISNDKLRQMYGNLTLSSAFAEADNILATAAKGIAEIITVPGYINVDFEDVKTVMQNSGVAIMGSASSEGEGRAYKAVQAALNSPLLNDNDIEGARYILLNITSGSQEVLMDEVSEITDYIQNQAGLTADIIWGNCFDESLGNKISVTLIATGFQTKTNRIEKMGSVIERTIPLTINNQSDIVEAVAVPSPVAAPISPVMEAPVIEAPVYETPVMEMPVAPVFETPVAQVTVMQTPVLETPTIDFPDFETYASNEIEEEEIASAETHEVAIEEEIAIEEEAQIQEIIFEATPTFEMEMPLFASPVMQTEIEETEIAAEVAEELQMPIFEFNDPDEDEEDELEELSEDFEIEEFEEMEMESQAAPSFSFEMPVATSKLVLDESDLSTANTYQEEVVAPAISFSAPEEPVMVLKNRLLNEEERVNAPIHFQAPSQPKQVNLFDFVPEVTNHHVTEEIAAEPFRLLNKEELEFTVINKTPQPSAEEQMLAEQDRRNKERIARLKELSMKLRTPNGIHDLETEPAYLRKKQALDAAPHSSESQVSRYTLGEENGEPQIKANNSFLHDNVD
jgi:cell division protein FtsZ